MLPAAENHEQLYDRFRWDIPEFYNIGVDVCDKWAAPEPKRLALIAVDKAGISSDYSFTDLRTLSNRLANLLSDRGIKKGDRVAILLPQSPETACAHIAVHKLGAISVPLFVLFGVDALQYRLADSGTRVVITDLEGTAKLRELKPSLPDLELIMSEDGGEKALDLGQELGKYGDTFQPERKPVAGSPSPPYRLCHFRRRKDQRSSSPSQATHSTCGFWSPHACRT